MFVCNRTLPLSLIHRLPFYHIPLWYDGVKVCDRYLRSFICCLAYTRYLLLIAVCDRGTSIFRHRPHEKYSAIDQSGPSEPGIVGLLSESTNKNNNDDDDVDDCTTTTTTTVVVLTSRYEEVDAHVPVSYE